VSPVDTQPVSATTATAPPLDRVVATVASAAAESRAPGSVLAAVVWLSTIVSLSVYGFWSGVLPADVAGSQLAQVLFVGALLGLTILLPALRPVRGYVTVLLTIQVVTGYLHPFLADSAPWRGWSSSLSGHWLLSTFGDRLLKLGEAALVVAVVLGLGSSRRDAFLTPGQLDAPAPRIAWLGMRADEPWTRYGRNLALILTAVFAVALSLMMPPTADGILRMLPFLPLALVVAGMNALYEEVMFRVAPLSQLRKIVGLGHAALLSAAYFGLGHFSGSIPSGPIGVLQAGLVGWLFARSMLETRGLAWPWFLHFVLDAVIFTFLAMQAEPVA
jgi:membrane protease YdiL (CAAX protease family)